MLLVALLGAGAAIGNLAIVAPIAVLAYAVSAMLAWNEREPRPPHRVRRSRPSPSWSTRSWSARPRYARRSTRPARRVEDISTELDRFERVVQRTAARAELLHQELDDGPPETVSAG